MQANLPSVNGEPVDPAIVAQEQLFLRRRYADNFAPDQQDALEQRVQEDAVQNALERLLLVQAARKTGSPIARKRVEARLAELRQQLGGDEALAGHLGVPAGDTNSLRAKIEDELRYDDLLEELVRSVPGPSPEECRSYYEEHRAEFQLPELVRAAHIVQAASPGRPAGMAYQNLVEVRQALLNGASFAELARAYSDCPDRDGDLGYFPRGRMVKPFEDVVFGLKPGEVSEVFWSEFGFHVARLTDRQEPRQQPYEEVADRIHELISNDRKNRRIGEYVDELRKTAVIESV